jgi:hypothetical protein
MAFILIILFMVVPPASDHPRIDHVDSIRFDSEKACKDGAVWFQASFAAVNGPSSPYQARIECMAAKE